MNILCLMMYSTHNFCFCKDGLCHVFLHCLYIVKNIIYLFFSLIASCLALWTYKQNKMFFFSLIFLIRVFKYCFFFYLASIKKKKWRIWSFLISLESWQFWLTIRNIIVKHLHYQNFKLKKNKMCTSELKLLSCPFKCILIDGIACIIMLKWNGN